MTAAEFRVVVHLTTIPVNGLLVAWVAIGRTAFLPAGTTGDLRLTGLVLAPALALLLGTTSALTSVGNRPHELTAGQFAALAGIWAALAGFGFFLVDDSPTGPTASPFTELAGSTLVDVSDALTIACLYGFVASYTALLLLLVRGQPGAVGVGARPMFSTVD